MPGQSGVTGRGELWMVGSRSGSTVLFTGWVLPALFPEDDLASVGLGFCLYKTLVLVIMATHAGLPMEPGPLAPPVLIAGPPCLPARLREVPSCGCWGLAHRFCQLSLSSTLVLGGSLGEGSPVAGREERVVAGRGCCRAGSLGLAGGVGV